MAVVNLLESIDFARNLEADRSASLKLGERSGLREQILESLLNSCEFKFSVSIHFSKESGKEEGWELDRRGHRSSGYRKRNAPRRWKGGLQNYEANQEAGVEEAKGEFEPSPVSQAAESWFTAVVTICVMS